MEDQHKQGILHKSIIRSYITRDLVIIVFGQNYSFYSKL